MHPAKLCLIAGLCLSFTLPAIAQSKQPKADEPVLGGPKVKEDGVPGEQRQFTPGRTRGKEMMGAEIPHRAFMRAVDALRNSEDRSIRLTSEQQGQIRKINEEFTSGVAKYRQQHGAEVRALLSQLSPEDRRRAQEFLARNGGENRRPELDKRKNSPTKGDEAMSEKPDPKKAEQARERIKELLASAPSPADTHARIHSVLTDGQKQAFKAELQKVRDDMDARRMGERTGEQKGDEPKGRARDKGTGGNQDAAKPVRKKD